MLYDEKNKYFINNINFNRDSKLFDIEEGFNKGNLFKNIYSKYKNYVYKLAVNNKRDTLLYKIQMYIFALKDLNLYLDVYPKDESIINEYQNNYGPLNTNEVNSEDIWTWINNPWPWDKGGK